MPKRDRFLPQSGPISDGLETFLGTCGIQGQVKDLLSNLGCGKTHRIMPQSGIIGLACVFDPSTVIKYVAMISCVAGLTVEGQIIDECHQEWLAIRIDYKLASNNVINAMKDLFIKRGVPASKLPLVGQC